MQIADLRSTVGVASSFRNSIQAEIVLRAGVQGGVVDVLESLDARLKALETHMPMLEDMQPDFDVKKARADVATAQVNEKKAEARAAAAKAPPKP